MGRHHAGNLRRFDARVGITDHAQGQLGDIGAVQLRQIGESLVAGTAYGEVESTKSVSELVAPVSGEVLAANADLADQPKLVNSEPYGRGWLLDVRAEARLDQALARLHDSETYRSLVQDRGVHPVARRELAEMASGLAGMASDWRIRRQPHLPQP